MNIENKQKMIKTGAKLIISDYNWLDFDLERTWIPKYTDNYFIYDRYHRFKENDKIKWQKNVGQNIYDIFDFIYNNYDNLPELAIFCRSCIFHPKDTGTPRLDANGKKISNGTCSEEFFQKIMNNKTFTEIHDFGIESPSKYFGQAVPASKFDDDNYGFLEINNSWYFSHHRGRYFNNLNTFLQDIYVAPQITEYIRFSPGASYIIPKNNMLKFNKNFYERLREILSWDVIVGEGHMIERCLYTLFSSDWEIKEHYKN
jgi:hypothetical protein